MFYEAFTGAVVVVPVVVEVLVPVSVEKTANHRLQYNPLYLIILFLLRLRESP